MEKLERFLSRPTAKPYKTSDIEASEEIHLNDEGLLEFGPNDIENPKNWSTARRWYITVVSVILVVNATFASSSPSGTLESLSTDLHVSTEAAGLVITLFLLGYCAGPLVFAPLSEFFGRRYIFYVTFTLYLAFNFLCAFTPNFGGLLVGRFLTGTFASAPLSNAPGVLADIWGPLERGNAMAAFSMMTFVGPALGPVISGFLELKKDWRWCFYVLLWLGGVTELLMFTIPETLPTIVLRNKAKRIRALKIPGYEDIKAPVEITDRTLAGMFRVSLTRPWKILVDPISFAVAVYLAVVYALLDKKKAQSGHKGVPEDRLPVAMLGGVMFPITMFWFAWSGEYNSVHWIVPTLAGVFLSTSILLIFVAYLNYLTDTYLMYAASALAANTVVRSAAGAAAPLFTQYMFDALGVGGGGSLIAGVACLLAPIPFVFYKYGGPIRERSKFAPTPAKSEEPNASKS
ncbi:hypothetical protein CUC08_Gglean013500 [Alternaria sp. MG1]|nr:hypothetical protein CUC08_Gglean013500 [Alternaria sp. MG1]